MPNILKFINSLPTFVRFTISFFSLLFLIRVLSVFFLPILFFIVVVHILNIIILNIIFAVISIGIFYYLYSYHLGYNFIISIIASLFSSASLESICYVLTLLRKIIILSYAYLYMNFCEIFDFSPYPNLTKYLLHFINIIFVINIILVYRENLSLQPIIVLLSCLVSSGILFFVKNSSKLH